MNATIRADQVGSFLRPPALLAARDDHAKGVLTDEQLRAVEDDSVLSILEIQKQVGIEVFTDGEYRRSGYFNGLASTLTGFVPDPDPPPSLWRGPNTEALSLTRSGAPIVATEVMQTRRATDVESDFMRRHSPGPFKITIPSPTHFVSANGGFKPGVTDKVYPTRWDLLQKLASICASEIRALAEEGVPYIQIDSTAYIDFVDERRRKRLMQFGVTDLERALEENLAADNECLEAGKRAGVTMALHMCRGNAAGNFRGEGGYDAIAERVFQTLKADRILLEYDTERAGGFEPLRYMPHDKIAVLGLVTTKTGELESEDMLLRRIEDAAKYLPLENLALSPQCGFASGARGNPLSWDQQWQKLRLVVDTARRVWG